MYKRTAYTILDFIGDQAGVFKLLITGCQVFSLPIFTYNMITDEMQKIFYVKSNSNKKFAKKYFKKAQKGKHLPSYKEDLKRFKLNASSKIKGFFLSLTFEFLKKHKNWLSESNLGLARVIKKGKAHFKKDLDIARLIRDVKILKSLAGQNFGD